MKKLPNKVNFLFAIHFFLLNTTLFILLDFNFLILPLLLTSILLDVYYEQGEGIVRIGEIIQIVVYEMNYSIISRRSSRRTPRHTERFRSFVSLQIYAHAEFWLRSYSRKLLFHHYHCLSQPIFTGKFLLRFKCIANQSSIQLTKRFFLRQSSYFVSLIFT